MRRGLVLAGVLALGLVGCEKQREGEREEGVNRPRDMPTREQAAQAQHEVEVKEESELPGTGGAGTQPQQPCTPSARMPAEVVTGKVSAVGAGTLSLEQPGGKVVKLFTDPGTCVLMGESSVAPDSLKPGVEVRAGYELNPQGQPVARVVRAGGGG
ncbi:hypothetical protein P2318_34565 [Myxococcaceae bacterium GXIMD 01537]